MNVKEIGSESVDWIHTTQDTVQWRILNEHGNEPSGSIKGGELLHQLSYSQLLKNNPALWSRLVRVILCRRVLQSSEDKEHKEQREGKQVSSSHTQAKHTTKWLLQLVMLVFMILRPSPLPLARICGYREPSKP
jgi:hypothetical protein